MYQVHVIISYEYTWWWLNKGRNMYIQILNKYYVRRKILHYIFSRSYTNSDCKIYDLMVRPCRMAAEIRIELQNAGGVNFWILFTRKTRMADKRKYCRIVSSVWLWCWRSWTCDLCYYNVNRLVKDKKVNLSLCNRLWRAIGLWDVEAPTFSRKSARRWR
jgi:hypothetical protein